jgi:hypothetical protein
MDNLAKEILKDVTLEEIAPKSIKRSPVDHWSPPILLERAAYLKKLARFGDGSATEILREYPEHTALLSFRGRDSDAEMDEYHAIFFSVLAGTATLVTGGTIIRARLVEGGITRGDSIEAGTPQTLKAGDIVHIPAGLAHQILVAGEKTITCFVMKIREVE